MCASMVTAMWLRAVLTARSAATREFLRRNLPSAAYLYDCQRRLACTETGRCDCGPMCTDQCDPHCGSLLSNVERVARVGTCFVQDFPDDKSNDADMILKAQSAGFLRAHASLRLEGARKRRVTGNGARSQKALAALLRANCPVLLNMYVYSN